MSGKGRTRTAKAVDHVERAPDVVVDDEDEDDSPDTVPKPPEVTVPPTPDEIVLMLVAAFASWHLVTRDAPPSMDVMEDVHCYYVCDSDDEENDNMVLPGGSSADADVVEVTEDQIDEMIEKAKKEKAEKEERIKAKWAFLASLRADIAKGSVTVKPVTPQVSASTSSAPVASTSQLSTKRKSDDGDYDVVLKIPKKEDFSDALTTSTEDVSAVQDLSTEAVPDSAVKPLEDIKTELQPPSVPQDAEEGTDMIDKLNEEKEKLQEAFDSLSEQFQQQGQKHLEVNNLLQDTQRQLSELQKTVDSPDTTLAEDRVQLVNRSTRTAGNNEDPMAEGLVIFPSSTLKCESLTGNARSRNFMDQDGFIRFEHCARFKANLVSAIRKAFSVRYRLSRRLSIAGECSRQGITFKPAAPRYTRSMHAQVNACLYKCCKEGPSAFPVDATDLDSESTDEELLDDLNNQGHSHEAKYYQSLQPDANEWSEFFTAQKKVQSGNEYLTKFRLNKNMQLACTSKERKLQHLRFLLRKGESVKLRDFCEAVGYPCGSGADLHEHLVTLQKRLNTPWRPSSPVKVSATRGHALLPDLVSSRRKARPPEVLQRHRQEGKSKQFIFHPAEQQSTPWVVVDDPILSTTSSCSDSD